MRLAKLPMVVNPEVAKTGIKPTYWPSKENNTAVTPHKLVYWDIQKHESMTLLRPMNLKIFIKMII